MRLNSTVSRKEFKRAENPKELPKLYLLPEMQPLKSSVTTLAHDAMMLHSTTLGDTSKHRSQYTIMHLLCVHRAGLLCHANCERYPVAYSSLTHVSNSSSSCLTLALTSANMATAAGDLA
mmetsp:Transcript_89325/g.158472  ORF Transcript_89325/g.158472 Transcript_89325/m.158472 type:complete len:120 (-) Transcript_89325:438-797(-)